MARARVVWLVAGLSASALAAPKTTIVFPNEPYAVAAQNGVPGWIKFTILTSDLTTVYFQDSDLYTFHYNFAVAELPQFAGMTPAQFDAVTLHTAGQQAILGAIVFPPLVFGNQVYAEYGIQLVGQDAYAPQLVRDLIYLVKSKVQASPDVQALYFPTFEQQASAEQNAAYFASEGIEVSSTERWADGNACYSHGWALGTLKYVAPADIDAAWLAGTLGPGDLLLTDAVPAGIPALAGVLTLGPATPNSHVTILAQTFRVPFAHLALAPDALRAQSLVGHRIVLRAEKVGNACRVRLISADHLDAPTVQQILALKVPPALNLTPMQPLGSYSAPAGGLVPADIRYFGGKAANFGVIRRTIPGNSPVATALSFDLWNAYLDQTISTGRTLRQEIAFRLSPYAWPPDMSDLDATLAGIRDLFRNTSQSGFAAPLEAAIVAVLQDPQYAFDPQSNIRFRSSTNVEDSEQFTGAGLYDSFSGCLADDLDSDGAGPSICDSTESGERGVFRAIRRVFASFYNLNAYLERLRHGVDESQVGMAMLVHHSFPDPIEMANGVGLVTRTSPSSQRADLVTQAGASAVTNPEPGAIPEEVMVSVFSSTVLLSVVQGSNLVQLGATVMTFPDEYRNLADLLLLVTERYATENGLGTFTLDFEYKKLAPDGRLSVDQVRRVPRASTTPTITPFLINEPATYCSFQGELGSVFGHHRLKSTWTFSTRDMWLTPQNLATSFLTGASIELAETCQTYDLSFAAPVWPATHGYTSGTATDGFDLPQLQNPRSLVLSTTPIPELIESQSPVLTLSDLGGIELHTKTGCLGVSVEYDQLIPGWYLGQPIQTTTDEVWLCGCLGPAVLENLLQTRTLNGPAGVSIVTRFYWPLHPPVGAGYTAPLQRFVDTTISGLTPIPIVLTGAYSQTYLPEHHNFSEQFLFEPVLEPGLPDAQRLALESAGVRAIHVRYARPTSQFTYYSDAAWSGPCLGCTGFDGDRDGYCTADEPPDCDDTDPGFFPPDEVSDLVFLDHEVLAWNPPGGGPIRYDVLRSTSRADFVTPAICVESDDAADVSATDVTVPGSGGVLYYLVRAETTCAGSLGLRSDGTGRVGRSCP